MRCIVKLSVALSLLTGCRVQPEAPPDKPGTSLPLTYPVLLFAKNRIEVVNTEERLTTTTGASGPAYQELQIVDSAGLQFEVQKVTTFGKKSWMLDMGTGQYRVHLKMKRLRQLDLQRVKQMVLEVVREPNSTWREYPNGVQVATTIVEGSQTLGSLMEACRTSWNWH